MKAMVEEALRDLVPDGMILFLNREGEVVGSLTNFTT